MNKLNLFPYFGGKYKLASKLIAMFPEHHCYVDVFGGAGNVLIQKPPSKVEVFNDIDSDIVNLFRVLRTDFDRFHHLVKHIPFSREEYYAYKESMKNETDSVMRAAMWFAVTCQAFSGDKRGGWRFTKTNNEGRRFKNKVDRLHLVVDRLREVQVENREFEFILDAYDDVDTFFYLDPPYIPDTRRHGGYKHEMTADAHERLVTILKGVQGKVLLSGYQHEIYDALDWQRFDIETTASSAGRTRTSGLQGEGNVKKKQKRVESVWWNYDSLIESIYYSTHD